MVWTILFRTLQSLIAIGGLVMGAFGIYFNYVQATNTPNGPFGLSILAWGFILIVVVSIITIIQLRLHIYKIENKVSANIKELRAFKVTIGNTTVDETEILKLIWREMLDGASNQNIVEIIVKQYSGSSNDSDAWTVANSILEHLKLYNIFQSEPRTIYHGQGNYQEIYWKLNDTGREICRHLEKS